MTRIFFSFLFLLCHLETKPTVLLTVTTNGESSYQHHLSSHNWAPPYSRPEQLQHVGPAMGFNVPSPPGWTAVPRFLRCVGLSAGKLVARAKYVVNAKDEAVHLLPAVGVQLPDAGGRCGPQQPCSLCLLWSLHPPFGVCNLHHESCCSWSAGGAVPVCSHRLVPQRRGLCGLLLRSQLQLLCEHVL